MAYADSGLNRSDVFITSKLSPKHLGYQSTLKAVETSLKNLRTDYLDLFIVHFPRCWPEFCKTEPEGTFLDSWRAMEGLVGQGKIRR